MDITIDLGQDVSLEIGQWEDLEYLIDLLNGVWESMEYRLEKVKGKKNLYLFIEDPLNEDTYECGLVEKRGDKAFAFSPAVHEMVMKAYEAYLETQN
jgi:hypothetical protein